MTNYKRLIKEITPGLMAQMRIHYVKNGLKKPYFIGDFGEKIYAKNEYDDALVEATAREIDWLLQEAKTND